MNSEEEKNLRRSLMLKYKSQEILSVSNSNRSSKSDLDGVSFGFHSLKVGNPESPISNNSFNSFQGNACDPTIEQKEEEMKNLELKHLKNKLFRYEETIENQKYEIEKLKKILQTQTVEKEDILNKQRMLQREQELNKERIDNLKSDLRQSNEELIEISISLNEERNKNHKIKEQNVVLHESLLEKSKNEKRLENFIAVETEKTKKLEGQLEYLLNKFNSQNEHLYMLTKMVYDQSEELFKESDNSSRILTNCLNRANI